MDVVALTLPTPIMNILKMHEPYQKTLLKYSEEKHQQDESSLLISEQRHTRTIRISFRWALACSLVLCSSVWVVSTITQFIHYWPTEREREIAESHGLAPTLETTKSIRDEQRIADSFRAALLARFDPKNKYVERVTDKHGKIHYIPIEDGCEATVMLVRHCEKEDIREHCSYLGFERSVYLASLFGDDEKDRWPLPSYIFALSPVGRENNRKMNFREIETVELLAQKAGVTIDDSYPVYLASELASEILTFLQSSQMCGKLTVISWKHSEISHLARKLGCGPSEGCPVRFICALGLGQFLRLFLFKSS